ncbi:MAG: LacI family DNA-binding transcriptional regulator [Acidimicrobiia bacterium]
MAERITLKDVAREAGVHVSTASRALNPLTASVVNPDTVERVSTVAKRLGYRPHPLARGLRTNQTMSVGMVIPDVENPLFGPIIAGAESVLVEEGYSVIIGNADRGAVHAESVVSNMLERHVDGLILATASRSDDVVSDLMRRGVPTVLVNRRTDERSIPSIVGDDYAGIGLAVQHLVSLGHENIGHVAGPAWVSTGLERRQAFLSWLEQVGLHADPGRVEEADWFRVEPGYRSGLELLGRRPEVTAIVAANDLLALGCYRAIRSLDMEVGVDVSVTGYNDIPLLDMMHPAMTTVRVPYRKLGAEGAKALLALMSGDDDDVPEPIELEPSLMVRSSTAPPREIETR